MEKIPVTVDKSHLITIGERLYTENVELLRELVNNSYDADATEVRISLGEDEITISDNGSGMNIEGLKQYFNIGSPFKKENPKSPKHGRPRIGEFGIGKFSVLSNCEHFEVYTKKGDFAGRVIFNKKEWELAPGEWQLPLIREEATSRETDGTRIILKGLKKRFDVEAVERRLIETLPLKAPDFTVFLNDRKLMPKQLAGRKIPFLEGTDFGIVHGEIVIVPASHVETETAGVLVRVRQVSVKRMAFGLEPGMLARVSGEANADFLKLTTDRNDFLMDTPEFDAFMKVMDRIINQAKEEIGMQSDEKENTRVKRALKEVTRNIEAALFKNREWCPPGLLPEADGAVSGPGEDKGMESGKNAGKNTTEEKAKKKRMRRPHLKQLSPSALMKKMKIGQMNLALVLDHFGVDGPESFIEGDIVYINRDHPLYERESVNRERNIMNIARLICQEISLMSNPRNPRHAYERQSKLLRDAFIK